jgi:hypothetical protein
VYFLTIDALLKDTSRKEFSQCTNWDEQPGVVIHRFWRGYSVSNISAAQLRNERLNEFYLTFNQTIVSVLRRHISAGWLTTGPLPSIALYVLTEGQYSNDTATGGYWTSLGMRRSRSCYTAEGVALFDEEPPMKHEPYKVLVNTSEFITEKRLEMCGGDLDNAVMVYSEPILSSYGLLRGFFHQADGLNARLVMVRRDIGHMIAGKRRFLASVFKHSLILNRLGFEHKRITVENSVEEIDRYLRGEVGDFRRESFGEDDPGEFLDDKLFQLHQRWTANEAQLTVLDENFRVVRQERLERVLFWLNIVGVLVAVVGVLVGVGEFIPDDVKTKIYSWIVRLFSKAPTDG